MARKEGSEAHAADEPLLAAQAVCDAAARGDHAAVVGYAKLGLAAKATNDGMTPLFIAASKGHARLVKPLVAGGASLTAGPYGTFDLAGGCGYPPPPTSFHPPRSFVHTHTHTQAPPPSTSRAATATATPPHTCWTQGATLTRVRAARRPSALPPPATTRPP